MSIKDKYYRNYIQTRSAFKGNNDTDDIVIFDTDDWVYDKAFLKDEKQDIFSYDKYLEIYNTKFTLDGKKPIRDFTQETGIEFKKNDKGEYEYSVVNQDPSVDDGKLNIDQPLPNLKKSGTSLFHLLNRELKKNSVYGKFLWDIFMDIHGENKIHNLNDIPDILNDGYKNWYDKKENGVWIPSNNFVLSSEAIDQLPINHGYKSQINVPIGRMNNKTLSFSVPDTLYKYKVDDVVKVKRNWFNFIKGYVNKVFDSSNFSVYPYKNCCYDITIIIWNPENFIIHKKKFICLPLNWDTSISGYSDPNYSDLRLNFSIVGEFE